MHSISKDFPGTPTQQQHGRVRAQRVSARRICRKPALLSYSLIYTSPHRLKKMNQIRKLPNYLSKFGLTSGLRLFSAVESRKPGRGQNKLALSLPGYSATVYLRDTVADRSTFWQCLVQQQYQTKRFPQHQRLVERYDELLRRGEVPLIIDCGGNIGLAAVWYAHQFPKARIVSIEPDEDNLEMLRLNTDSFRDRVTIVQGGVWNQQGALSILNPNSGSAAFRVEFSDKADHGGIPAYTIDDLCQRGGSSMPLVVKLDIEGAQDHLFESNTDWVGRATLITLELDDWLLPWQGTSRNFFSCISRYPFDYLLGGESIFCFRDHAANASGA